MRKGEITRATILEAAIDMAAAQGLEGITIGGLAERTRMSKSGVFAHFGSREDLQVAVLKAYERRFVDEVLLPALKESRGLPRLRSMLALWTERTAREADQGCLWISSASEYDDRPGVVRDELVTMVQGWKRELLRAIRQAVSVGDLPAGTDADQLVFELYGLILALHHDGRLLGSHDALARARRGVERLLAAPFLATSRDAAQDAARPSCAQHERST